MKNYVLFVLILTGCATQQPILEPVGYPQCPGTLVTAEDWDSIEDERNLLLAKEKCRTRNGGRSPCLIRFTKLGELRYTAICGEKRATSGQLQSSDPFRTEEY